MTQGKELEHLCPDGMLNKWQSRVPYPKSCPRCKTYLRPKTEKSKTTRRKRK